MSTNKTIQDCLAEIALTDQQHRQWMSQERDILIRVIQELVYKLGGHATVPLHVLQAGKGVFRLVTEEDQRNRVVKLRLESFKERI